MRNYYKENCNKFIKSRWRTNETEGNGITEILDREMMIEEDDWDFVLSQIVWALSLNILTDKAERAFVRGHRYIEEKGVE